METEEIYSVTIFPLISSPFAVQWSADNRISLLTERGVHVFELLPSPTSPQPALRFARSFVYPPPDLAAEAQTRRLASKIWDMRREEVYPLLIEENLTPKVAELADAIPKITEVSWSPRNLIRPDKCLLAILTSAGTLMVLCEVSRDWYSAYSLSRLPSDDQEEETREEDAFELKRRIEERQACAMAWSRLLEGFAYLAVARRNGDVVIYKIPRITDRNTMSREEIVGRARSGESVRIRSLLWVDGEPKQYRIIVGLSDGRIWGLTFVERGEHLEHTTTTTYYEWSDRVAVRSLYLLSPGCGTTKILVPKGCFLFLLCLSDDGSLKSVQRMQTEGFSITGITSLGEERALIATENGILFTIDARGDRFLRLDYESRLASGRQLGLAHSPSRAIFVGVSSPSTIYDHLVVKEPSKMSFFVLKGEEWNPFDILRRKREERLTRVWDCIELIRVRTARAVESANLSTPMPKPPTDLETLTIYELRVAMWLSVIGELVGEVSGESSDRNKLPRQLDSIADDGEASEARIVIFVRTACDYIERLVDKSPSALSEDQKLAINLLRMYLEVYLAGEENAETSPVAVRAAELARKTVHLAPFAKYIEACNLCGKPISDLSWKVSRCLEGHELPRCAITLLQITTIRYKTCPICGHIFHPCLDEEFEEVRCLYCDVPALDDPRIISNEESEISKGRSLSKKPSLLTNGSKDRDSDAVPKTRGKSTGTSSIFPGEEEDEDLY